MRIEGRTSRVKSGPNDVMLAWSGMSWSSSILKVGDEKVLYD